MLMRSGENPSVIFLQAIDAPSDPKEYLVDREAVEQIVADVRHHR